MKKESSKKSLPASLIFAAVLGGIMALLSLNRFSGDLISILCHVGWIVFVSIIGFLIMFTGRISRWRALFLIVLAWAFIFYFKAFLLGLGRSPFFSPQIQEVPFCHIAIASSIGNYIYQQYLAFQSGAWSQWGPLSLGFLWLILTLAVGQAFCSWVCFYGGLDEGFSRILRKSPFPNFRIPRWLRDLPAAILVFMILISLAHLLPIFCLWLCPLKVTTAFLDTYGPTRHLQMALFIVIGTLALVVLPLLLKKRAFCGLICPFGAWQAFFGRVNPFRVTIDRQNCSLSGFRLPAPTISSQSPDKIGGAPARSQAVPRMDEAKGGSCGLCVKTCPTFVLTEDSVKSASISAYCNRCGQCIDACPTGAISYTVMGKPLAGTASVSFARRIQPLKELLDGRSFFVLSSLLFGGAVGNLFVPQMIARIFRFILL